MHPQPRLTLYSFYPVAVSTLPLPNSTFLSSTTPPNSYLSFQHIPSISLHRRQWSPSIPKSSYPLIYFFLQTFSCFYHHLYLIVGKSSIYYCWLLTHFIGHIWESSTTWTLNWAIPLDCGGCYHIFITFLAFSYEFDWLIWCRSRFTRLTEFGRWLVKL